SDQRGLLRLRRPCRRPVEPARHGRRRVRLEGKARQPPDLPLEVARFLVRRLLWAVFLFVVATLVAYLIFFVVGGDPSLIAAGSGATATPEFLAHVRHVLHLDLPVYQQYWLFVWNLIRHGSLGYSFRNGASVRSVVGQDAPVTASVVFGGAVLWLGLSIPVGILSALRP